MTIMYGIPNCDTIKKAKKWLENHNIAFEFHDYRKQGLTLEQLAIFEAALGWQALVNKRGTTFRQLPKEQQDNLTRESALALLIAHPAMIKRPLLAHNSAYHLGFKAEHYQEIFA